MVGRHRTDGAGQGLTIPRNCSKTPRISSELKPESKSKPSCSYPLSLCSRTYHSMPALRCHRRLSPPFSVFVPPYCPQGRSHPTWVDAISGGCLSLHAPFARSHAEGKRMTPAARFGRRRNSLGFASYSKLQEMAKVCAAPGICGNVFGNANQLVFATGCGAISQQNAWCTRGIAELPTGGSGLQ